MDGGESSISGAPSPHRDPALVSISSSLKSLSDEVDEHLGDLKVAASLPNHEPDAARLPKFRAMVRKLSKLCSSNDAEMSAESIPFYRNVRNSMVQPARVQQSARALLKLLVEDLNHDSDATRRALSSFQQQQGDGSSGHGIANDDNEKGLGYLKALAEAGKLMERGRWEDVWLGGDEQQRKQQQEEVSSPSAELELRMLQTLSTSNYLLTLIKQCKALTRYCHQKRSLSNAADTSEEWKELLQRYRWCRDLVDENVFFLSK